MSQHVEHIPVPNVTGPGVRGIKRPFKVSSVISNMGAKYNFFYTMVNQVATNRLGRLVEKNTAP